MQIPAGTKMRIGKPATPLSPEVSRAIAAIAASVPEVLEAHLPQMYVEEMIDPAAQVLVIAFPESFNASDALTRILRELSRLLLPGAHIDVLPFTANDATLESLRGAGCRIFLRDPNGEPVFDDPSPKTKMPPRQARQWWRIW